MLLGDKISRYVITARFEVQWFPNDNTTPNVKHNPRKISGYIVELIKRRYGKALL